MGGDALVVGLALCGLVIVLSTVASGAIERSGLPFVALFLALGAGLGPAGLGVLEVGLQAPLLRVVATLGLALVLFTDAITLDLREVRRHRALALRVLGPGTLLSALLVALAAHGLLGLAPAAAAVLGAALASTDPVLLRGVLRRRDIPDGARVALRLESGLNDVVLLPIVLIAMEAMAPARTPGAAHWAGLALRVLVLGPLAGAVVALVSIGLLVQARRLVGVRRDYESLYSLGVAFSAFAAAEVFHGSGFLAAFAAGLTINALDPELCDCFVEYGETTAELSLLLTFVLFGASPMWRGLGLLTGVSAAFVALALLVRPVAFLASLAGLRLERRDRVIVAWFGPRGLSALLLVLVPVFARVPGSEPLFAWATLVILASIVLHGGTPLLLSRWRASPDTAPPADDGLRMSLADFRARRDSGHPPVVFDVRTERTAAASGEVATGAIRTSLEDVVAEARRRGIPPDAWIVAFCA